jgi:hypothetical protein
MPFQLWDSKEGLATVTLLPVMPESSTAIWNVKVPAFVGVPESTPAVLTVIPVGSVPERTRQF